MELKKNLPEIFEEFAEGRQNAFLNVKKIKDQDKPVIGIFCTYFPQELAVAMNAAVVSLCATSDETIPAAEQDPAPISGTDLLNTMVGTTFNFERETIPAQMEALVEKIKAEGKVTEKKPRILITGCPMGGATMKVVKAIEENGATVVCYENCSGAKAIEENVDESIPDVYEALARKYMNIGCSCMSPNDNRIKLLDRMIDEYSVDGVIDVELQACQTYAVETLHIKRFVNEEKKIPYMSLETDYSQADVGQLTTRIAAFIEML